METFRTYLQSKNIVEKNISHMSNLAKDWLTWLKKEAADSTYQDLINYIEYLQKQGRSTHHINRSLQTISHYYRYQELADLAMTTRVKGTVHKARLKPFTAEELDSIYDSFETKRSIHKIMLGLIIYQGMELGDFSNIEIKDIDLSQGTVYIPSRGQRNSRTVQLYSKQIIPIHSYIQEHRPNSTTRPNNLITYNYHQLHDHYKQLSRQVKHQSKAKLNLDIHKLNHLRQSRIALWIKEYGLRKSQYLAGFRRVISAERYKKADLTDLIEQVRKYHPY